MTCVEIILALCKQRGIAVSKVERDLQFGNGYFKNRKSKSIPGDRLTKVADYFGVTPDFLLGLTPESYMMVTEYNLSEAEKAYEKETDEEKKYQLAVEIDTLRESLEDQRLTDRLMAMQGAKKAPTTNGERLEDSFVAAAHKYSGRLKERDKKIIIDMMMALADDVEGLNKSGDSD